MTIQEAISLLTHKNHLTVEDTQDAFREIMNGQASPAQIGAFIVALRMKGETIEEITGAVMVMREKVTRIIPSSTKYLIDTCGTGGDGSNSFNISTATAFVAAGAGALVAKHGNRSVSSRCGSADVLESLGVNVTISPELVTRCINEIGIGFLFAQTLHGAMKFAAGPRKEIGIKSIFNILGPLTNPAFAPGQVLGVFSPDLTNVMAHVLRNVGTQRAFIVHGKDGLDEISITSETLISELCNNTITSYTVTPSQFGFELASKDSLLGGSAQDNACIIKAIFDGQKGAPRDIVVLNAGFALVAAGIAQSPQEGIQRAMKSIDSGSARTKLEELVLLTNS